MRPALETAPSIPGQISPVVDSSGSPTSWLAGRGRPGARSAEMGGTKPGSDWKAGGRRSSSRRGRPGRCGPRRGSVRPVTSAWLVGTLTRRSAPRRRGGHAGLSVPVDACMSPLPRSGYHRHRSSAGTKPMPTVKYRRYLASACRKAKRRTFKGGPTHGTWLSRAESLLPTEALWTRSPPGRPLLVIKEEVDRSEDRDQAGLRDGRAT